MTTTTLTALFPEASEWQEAFDNVQISVNAGRRFTFIKGEHAVTVTMKEIIQHFQALTSGESFGYHSGNLRDNILLLNFRANAKLKNNKAFGAQFCAWLRRLFGGTLDKNSHIDKLCPVGKSTKTMEVTKGRVLEQAYAAHDSDPTICKTIDRALQDHAQIGLQKTILHVVGHDDYLRSYWEELNHTQRAVQSLQETTAPPEVERCTNALGSVKEFPQIEAIDLIYQIANKAPFTASLCTFSALPKMDAIIVCARIPKLRRIIERTFKKIDRLEAEAADQGQNN